jgi:hypothetical protein
MGHSSSPFGDHQSGELQIITQPPFFCFLFFFGYIFFLCMLQTTIFFLCSWLHHFPLFVADCYLISPSNIFLSLFFWLYLFPLSTIDSYHTSPFNKFISLLSWLYHFFLSIADNYLTFFYYSLLPTLNQLQP